MAVLLGVFLEIFATECMSLAEGSIGGEDVGEGKTGSGPAHGLPPAIHHLLKHSSSFFEKI